MTKQEAIRHLQAARLMLIGKDRQPISDLYDALTVAIEALEQPTVDAVPVEWIQGFMNRLRNNGQTVCVAAIQGMLEAYGANGEREPANGYGVMAARMLE